MHNNMAKQYGNKKKKPVYSVDDIHDQIVCPATGIRCFIKYNENVVGDRGISSGKLQLTLIRQTYN